jgi:hypothetical protein
LCFIAQWKKKETNRTMQLSSGNVDYMEAVAQYSSFVMITKVENKDKLSKKEDDDDHDSLMKLR